MLAIYLIVAAVIFVAGSIYAGLKEDFDTAQGFLGVALLWPVIVAFAIISIPFFLGVFVRWLKDRGQ